MGIQIIMYLYCLTKRLIFNYSKDPTLSAFYTHCVKYKKAIDGYFGLYAPNFFVRYVHENIIY